MMIELRTTESQLQAVNNEMQQIEGELLVAVDTENVQALVEEIIHNI